MDQAHWKWRTGGQGSSHKITVEWFDHNGVEHTDEIEIEILNVDKPRTLEVHINGETVYSAPSGVPFFRHHKCTMDHGDT